jgi:hypothetical protein
MGALPGGLARPSKPPAPPVDPLLSDERPIYMLVTLEGSEAKQDGNDGMLLFCSEECGNELKNALKKEISLGNIFESFNFE